MLLTEAIGGETSQLISRGLADLDQQGHWQPILATEVPDASNGGLSPDGMTVTWHLKPNLKWSDGTPLTSDDLRFTWEICGAKSTGCSKSAGFVDITSVDTPDPLTIVLHYDRYYDGYKGQFKWGILPRHSPDIGAAADIAKWKYDRTVNPSDGPFMIKDWTAGTGMTLVRNPNYYEAGKPYLDQINISFVPAQETQRQELLSGGANLMTQYTPAPAQLQEMKDKGFTIGTGSSPFFNRFQMNLRNPILSDINVRKAIYLGTDWKKVTATWNFPGIAAPNYMTARWDLWGPNYACGFPQTTVDKQAAQQMLDQAGWTVNPSTGIRQKNGVPLHLRITTYTGFGQEDNVVIWISELKTLGIDAVAANVDPTVLYSSYTDKSPAYTGDYDLLYWDFGTDLGSPVTEAQQFYMSTSIPSAQNPFGQNFMGINDPQVDSLINQAGKTLDVAQTKALLCQVTDIVSNKLSAEHWNGTTPDFQISSPNLKGWKDGEQYVYFGSDAQNWYLQN